MNGGWMVWSPRTEAAPRLHAMGDPRRSAAVAISLVAMRLPSPSRIPALRHRRRRRADAAALVLLPHHVLLRPIRVLLRVQRALLLRRARIVRAVVGALVVGQRRARIARPVAAPEHLVVARRPIPPPTLAPPPRPPAAPTPPA